MPLTALRALVSDDLRDEFDRLAAPIERDLRIVRTLLDGALDLVTTILPDQENDRLLGATTEPLAAVDHVDPLGGPRAGSFNLSPACSLPRHGPPGSREMSQLAAAPELMTAPEVAPMLRSSLRHVRELTARGDLPCVRLGRKVLYPRDAIERYLAENTKPGRRAAPTPGLETTDDAIQPARTDLARPAARRARRQAVAAKRAAVGGEMPLSASGRKRPIRDLGASS